MLRTALSGATLAAILTMAGGALAQGTPPLPAMPRPPSFEDPTAPAAKARKPTKRTGKAAAAASAPSGSGTSFERPKKFVPAEFDQERSGGGRSGAQPMMTGSGRPGMGMKF